MSTTFIMNSNNFPFFLSPSPPSSSLIFPILLLPVVLNNKVSVRKSSPPVRAVSSQYQHPVTLLRQSYRPPSLHKTDKSREHLLPLTHPRYYRHSTALVPDQVIAGSFLPLLHIQCPTPTQVILIRLSTLRQCFPVTFIYGKILIILMLEVYEQTSRGNSEGIPLELIKMPVPKIKMQKPETL